MIEVKEILTKKQWRDFFNFPKKLYKDCPQFVPALDSDEKPLFNRKKNAAFEYCDMKAYLAYNDGKIVGRVCAIINHAYNKKMDVKQIRFSRFDVIDDIEVTKALMRTVKDYALENGLDTLVGPNGYCDFDKEGMLIEGYDQLNMILTYYNYPYYKEHLESLGFQKEVDWMEYKVYIPEKDNAFIKKLDDLATKIAQRYEYKMHVLKSLRGVEPIVVEAFHVINDAFKELYGVVPLNDGQMRSYVKQFVPLAHPDFAFFVRNKEGEMIGMGFLVPSLAQAVKKSNGKFFPFGIFRILKALHKRDVLDMYIMAVKPEYQNKGVNVMILNQAVKSCMKHGAKYAETGPELEENIHIQSQWKNFKTEQHKRRRLFRLDLTPENIKNL